MSNTTPKISIHDVTNDKIIERQMTSDEWSIREQEIIAAKLDEEKQSLEIAKKTQLKAELLVKLGITEEEAKLLLS